MFYISERDIIKENNYIYISIYIYIYVYIYKYVYTYNYTHMLHIIHNTPPDMSTHYTCTHYIP